MAETTPQLFSQQVPKSPEKVSRLSQPGYPKFSRFREFLELGTSIAATIFVTLLFATKSEAQDMDLDRIPDAWENQYGLNASIENFKVGSSVDGNLTVNAGQSAYLNDTAIVISSMQNSGSPELTGSIPIITRIGDVFLLHVT